MKILYLSNIGTSDLGFRKTDKPLFQRGEEIYEKTKEMFINKDFSLHTALQYLNENELDNSGYEADIYGALVEFVAYDIGFNIAYNKANKKSNKNKKSKSISKFFYRWL